MCSWTLGLPTPLSYLTSYPIQIISFYSICFHYLFERFEGVSFVLLGEFTSLHRRDDIPLISVNINIKEEMWIQLIYVNKICMLVQFLFSIVTSVHQHGVLALLALVDVKYFHILLKCWDWCIFQRQFYTTLLCNLTLKIICSTG
jgi:hypothetical protein